MSGMIGSRQGWREVPYVACPAEPAEIAQGLERVDWGEGEAEAWIVPGLLDESRPGQPDVMRAAEAQALGAPAALRTAGGLLCVPGTQCKWGGVADGVLQSFAPYMTGAVSELPPGLYILSRSATKLA